MLTPAFLQKLNITCKGLTIIKLKYVDLSVITVNDLKDNFSEMFLMRCEIPVNWFTKNNFKCLETLDLTESARVCSKHLIDIVENCKKTLKRLILSSCYRVDDKAVEIITLEFLNLICLKIDGTNITELALHWICNRLKILETLDIRNCKLLKNPDVNFIKESYRDIDSFKLFN